MTNDARSGDREPTPERWLLTRAKSALENWGRHFDWCAVNANQECSCGLARMIADLEPVPAPPADESLDPALLRMALKGSWAESESLRAALRERDAELTKHAEIFAWLLGESGEFPVSMPGKRYGFRSELRKRLDAARVSPDHASPTQENATDG